MMYEPTYQELIEAGFEPHQPWTPPTSMGLEIKGKTTAYIHVEHTSDNKYEIHLVKRSDGTAYTTLALNNGVLDHIKSLEDLINFVSMNESKKVA